MPIYEYKCRECGDRFEKLVRSASQEQETQCPACCSPNVARQMSVCARVGGDSPSFVGGGDSGGSCAPTGGG
jgi:putative FmdB family regulatory protein